MDILLAVGDTGGLHMSKALLVTFLVIALSSCAAPAEVNQIGPNRYAVNVGAMGIEGGEAEAKNKALAAANEYCADLGKQVSLVNLQSRGPVEWGSAAGSASAIFECIAK